MSSVVDRLGTNRDLVAVGTLAVAAVVTSSWDPAGSVWLPLALLLLIILPGYVTIAFAYAGDHQESGPSGVRGWTLVTLLERSALVLGAGLALLPILAILTYLSPSMVTSAALVNTVSMYVLLGSVATVIRRKRQSGTSVRTRESVVGRAKQRGGSVVQSARRLSLLQGVLAVSVVFAMASLGVAVAVPSPGSSTTDLHLLTEQDGRLVANEYPDTLTEGESTTLTVGVTNEEHQRTEYTVVAELQRVQIDGSSVSVMDKHGVGRYSFGLEHGSTWQRQLDVQGSLTGENLRLAVYLYRGDAPEAPSTTTAYRTTYVWIDVLPSGSNGE